MNTATIQRIFIAMALGLVFPLALLFIMATAQPAHGAPLTAGPVLSVTKQGASNWTQRIKLVFTNTVAEDVNAFPVLVTLNSSRINYAQTQNAGQDIRFVDPDGTPLPHEIDRWDETGTSQVWVKVPNIPASSSTDYIWLYYGNPTAPDGQNPAAVWAGSFKGVWHMDGGFLDSSGFDNHGTSTIPPVTSPNGQIDNAQNYDGKDDFIDVGSDASLDNIFSGGGTVSAWINPRGLGHDQFGRIADKSTDNDATDGWAFELDRDRQSLRFNRGYSLLSGGWVVTSSQIQFNQWQFVTVTYSDGAANDPSITINAAPQTLLNDVIPFGSAVTDAPNSLRIGNVSPFAGDRAFDGLLDEVRVATTVRSSGWITSQYRSMIDNFIGYGAAEAVNLPGGGIIGAPYTYTVAVSNSGTSAATNVVVSDTLPAGANYRSGGTYIPADNAVQLTIPTVLTGQEQTATFTITTCRASLLNTGYRVISSNEGVTSGAGPDVLSVLSPPTINAAFNVSALNVTLGNTVSFTDTSTTNGGPLVARQWDFGDTVTASGSTTSHTYSSTGTFTVTLTVTDTCGFTATAQQSLNVVTPVLAVTKLASPEPVAGGTRLTYTVVVSNSGQGTAGNVTISDTLSTDVTFIPGSVTIQPGSVGGASGTPPLIAGGMTLAGGQQLTVTFGVTVSAALAHNTTLINTAAVTSSQTPSPVTGSVASTVEARVDLSINKTVAPLTPVLPGQTITYTVTYANLGPHAATGVVLTDIIPVTLTNVSISNSGAAITPTGAVSRVWQVADLAPSEGGTITVTGTVDPLLTQDTVFTNTATISLTNTADNVESGPAPNSSSAATTVSLPRTAFSSATYSVGESNGPALITVTLTAAPLATVTVNYRSTAGGSATPGTDFTPVNSQVSFAPGQTTAAFTVPVIADTIDEPNETVNLSLTGASGAVLTSPTAAVLTILDDDDPPVADFSSAAFSVIEDNGPAVISVTLSHRSAFPIQVNYRSTTSGSATPGVDFTPVSSTLTFPPLSLTQTFTVPIAADLIDEPDETVGLQLTGAVSASVGSANNPATLTILDDDDPPLVNFANAPYSASESAGTATITAALSRASGKPITVTYTITNGTATTADGDYVPGSGTLQFLPGTTAQTFTVTINNDNRDELDETVTLRLGPAVNAGGTPVTTTLTILDDDEVRLAINKQGSPPVVSPGQQIQYTVVISNSGNAPATGGVLSDPVPTHTQFVPGSLVLTPGGAGTVGSPPQLLTGVTLAAGQKITVTFAVTVTKPLTSNTIIANTATFSSTEPAAPVSDVATSTVQATPAVNLEKAGPPVAFIGQPAVFTFTVTNIGESLIRVQQLRDNLGGSATFLSGDTNGNGWIDLTESWLYHATYTPQLTDPDPFTNTATVTATDALNVQVTDTATASTNIDYRPALKLVKSGPPSAVVGDTVPFTFSISHDPAGDGSPVTVVAVNDNPAGPASLVSNGDGDNLLESGETWLYSASYTILPTTPNPFTDTGTVFARDKDNQAISAFGKHTMLLSGFDPRLFVDKDGPAEAIVGDTAVYTFTVINVNLTALLAFDLGPISMAAIGDGSPIDLTVVNDNVAGKAGYISGDFNGNSKLDGAEAWVYTASHVISAGDSDPLQNTVTVQGTDPENDLLQATDIHLTDILHTSLLQIEYTAPSTATVEQTFGITFTVSHAPGSDGFPVGSIGLTNSLAPTTPLLDGDTNGNSQLDSGEKWRYALKYTVKISDPKVLINDSTLHATDIDGDPIEAASQQIITVDRATVIGDFVYYLPVIRKEN